MSSVETNIPMALPGTHMEPDVLETLFLSQQYILSDNSRRLVQTSDSRTQSAVYSSDHGSFDTSNQLDTDDDCKQSYSTCDTELHANSDLHPFACEVGDRMFVKASQLKSHVNMIIHMAA